MAQLGGFLRYAELIPNFKLVNSLVSSFEKEVVQNKVFLNWKKIFQSFF